ncbi:hypothetical protein IFM89_034498 [Coptis chinensis]|uniref:Uncharacterized protein n=1 Tax=Coptis chinensis TaxID=261450 RepID=A0A835HP92_9MAGN|nr:hypothetical protein IFM89_034498 [Coptis chinensis]
MDYSYTTFSSDFLRFLRYHPINEFEFFFESIGIPFLQLDSFLPEFEFFLNEDGSLLNVARTLSLFGFPWNKLGKLYREEVEIFGKDCNDLDSLLCRYVSLGFDTCTVVGICLAFPFVLSGNDHLSIGVDALFGVLKRVFVDFDLKSSVDGNVDASYEFCRKIKVFIDLGCEMNDVGEFIGKRWDVFLECSEEVLVTKVEYFKQMNIKKEDVGLFLLCCPEVLQFDLESPVFSAMNFLKHFGLSDEELDAIALEYPYVLGKNRLANLPHFMRAIDRHEWFFDKIMNGNHHLLADLGIDSQDEDFEKDFKDCLERFQSGRSYKHALAKLDFLHEIGFGENLVTLKVLSNLHGTKSELQVRFNYLLGRGVAFSRLSKMIKMLPKVLNQKPELLKDKVDFLCNEVGMSVQFLNVFPGFLCFDLENRMKPRLRIHKWILENGFHAKEYSLASIIATSENRFIDRLVGIHPTVLKQWFERFSSKNHSYSPQEP